MALLNVSLTVIQAELPPELATRAHDFVAKSGKSDLSGLVVEALHDYFEQHATPSMTDGIATDRQQVFQALATQTDTCDRVGWDGHGADPVSLDAYRYAYRFIESLPAGSPMPGVGAEPDGHLTLEWYRTPSRVLSVSIGPNGELSYAALLGDTSRRTGSELFSENVPHDLLHLISQVFAA